jgi:DNA primase catalytic core
MTSSGHDRVNEIKNKLEIVKIIEKNVVLHSKGNGEYVGAMSPSSKSGASLKVNQRLQIWKNFATGEGGDVFDWIGFINGLDARGSDFPEVLQIAADLAGVELKEMTEEEKDAVKEKVDIHSLYTEAAEIYHWNLKPDHYTYIKEKWGITSETVDRLKIGYATTDRDLKELDATTLKKSGLVYVNNGLLGGEVFKGRIIFPYWKNGKVGYLIGREMEETPEAERENGMKYKKLLVHKEGREYVSPLVQNSYFYGEDSLRGSDYCIITEGVTDCIVMSQAGFPCISPVTVRFREQDHPKLLSLTKRLERVYICNDNEANQTGLKGALNTAEALEAAGIEARLMELPKPESIDKIDIAEYMKNHTPDDFKQLMSEAVSIWTFKLNRQKVPEKALDRLRAFESFISNDLCKMSPNDWDIFVMNEVREYFKLKRGEVKRVVAENRPIPKVKIDQRQDESSEALSEYKRFYDISINREGKPVVKLIYSEIAAYLAENNNVISYAETLYVYRDGIYRLGEIELKAEAQSIIKDLDFKGSITEATREIIHYLTYEKPEIGYPFNEYGNIIPVENGLLKIDFENNNIKLMPFDPKYKFNFKLPVKYDPSADPETIDNIIRGYVDPDEREGDNGKGETVKLGYSDTNLLYQIPAQAILQMVGAATFKKAYLLQGDAHAGKSSYLELLKRSFGEENLSDVSLQALVSDRFAIADLEGKPLNCYDDLADIPLKEGGIFKTLTGKYFHRVQKKGQQAYNAKIKAVHVYTCNTPPTFSDSIANDTAFWERWEFINFTNLFEIDPYFYDRTFTPENLSGFFNQVLETVIEIKTKGKLLIDSAAGEVREKWQSNADPLYKFIDGYFTKEPSKTIYLDKTRFLHSYVKYCNEKKVDPGKIPGSVTMFTKLLFKYDIATKQIKTDGVQQPWVYCLPYSWKEPSSPYYVEPIARQTEQMKF